MLKRAARVTTTVVLVVAGSSLFQAAAHAGNSWT